MKCSKCGREFGGGANCQNCGVDRVTGLGNYSGYNRPSGSYEPHYSSSNNGGYASNTMVCYACSEIVPKNSIYCPACGRQLLVECPKCGSTYSSQYKICSKCGTNRDSYYKQKEAEKQRAIKEEEERKRKQREWEQSPEYLEKKAKQEAEHLRLDLTDGWKLLGMLIAIPFAVVLVIGVTEIKTSDSTSLILILLTVIGIPLIWFIIDKFISHYRIEKWKQEHPNDPRSKYL